MAGVLAAALALVLILLLRGLFGGDSSPEAASGPTPSATVTVSPGGPPTATASGPPSVRPTAKATPKPAPKPSVRPTTSRTSAPGRADCSLASLPDQAEDTVEDIYDGGPYPYRQDGVIFDNRERRLPSAAHGYYHEFTVVTPGSSDRGARRIIVGGPDTEAPEVLYYTGNHYASFCLVSGLD